MLQTLLKQRNAYYAHLSENGQKKFENRLLEFIQSKTFVGHEKLVVTDEMKILISAPAIQLSFGLEDYLFPNFHTINIFPNGFRSKQNNVLMKSLTVRDGSIYFSWKDFESTSVTPADNFNLGLYEMAHVLHIDLNDKKKHNNHFSGYLIKWKQGVLADFYRMKSGKLFFFKKYGTTNMYDFLALCTEYFFEIPQEFQAKLPQLYGHTALLLNQDILNKENDYTLRKEYDYIPENTRNSRLLTDGSNRKQLLESEQTNETKLQRFIRRKGLHVAMAVTLLGFIGIPILFWVVSVTVISIGTLLLLLFAFGALGLLQWKVVKGRIDMVYHQFAMYAFVGVGVCSVNLLLLLNYLISTGSYTETIPVIRQGGYYIIAVVGEKSSEELERCLSVYAKDNDVDVYSTTEATVTFDKGLLGFDVIDRCEFQ